MCKLPTIRGYFKNLLENQTEAVERTEVTNTLEI